MSSKITYYLASQNSETRGIKLDLNVKTATGVSFTSQYDDTRLGSLEALTKVLESIDYASLKEPVQLFINENLIENIINGYYKFWLTTGKMQNGTIVSDEEIALWTKFHQIYATNSLFIILHSTRKARISDNYRKMVAKKKSRLTPAQIRNDRYSGMAWDMLKKAIDENAGIDETSLENAL